MKDNPYIILNNLFVPKCFNLQVDYVRIGFTAKQIVEKHDMSQIDILQYLDDETLAKIKKQKMFLVFDFSQEGYYQKECNLFECLDYNFRLYNISKSQLLYLCSNPNEVSAFGIQPYVYHPWIDFMQQNYITNECDKAFEFTVNKCIENYNKEIYYSSFNKTWDRPWRDYFHYLLYKNKILNKGFVSNHNKLDKLCNGIEINKKSYDRFKQLLPLKFDFDYFWSAGKGYQADLYAFTTPQFHIVGESICDLEYTCFYSEKTFKPIAYFQPFFTLGPANFHKDLLSNIDIKLYDQLNDFNLDDDKDIIWQASITAAKLKKFLASLEKTNRIDWRFKDEKTLKHNWIKFKNFNQNKKMFKKLNNMLTK